ncbi:hypothetical protein BC829DRAFT_49377 [Chytridium lagenaria]|nr:hypothetical protein BC829DRAFT_49377 [Chytridium lagenaria]
MMTAPVSVEMTNENRREEGSKRLGTYMLQGWVLTDVPCTKPGCDMPTLRAKDDRTKYVCALCDDPRPIPPVRNVGRPSAMVADDDDIEELDEEEDADEAMDDFEMAPLTPAEADRISRRREASDRASRLMGQRLLSGWTMLAETCNSRSSQSLEFL